MSSTSTPLHEAAEAGDLGLCQSLVSDGHDVNSPNPDNRNYTPLHLASLRGRNEVCIILLDSGAELDSRDDNGFTPIILAAQQGHLATVRLLQQRGADVLAAANSGTMAIHMAAEKNRAETVQYLVEEAGVGVDTVSGAQHCSMYLL